MFGIIPDPNDDQKHSNGIKAYNEGEKLSKGTSEHFSIWRIDKRTYTC
jgi:hypothetical protein